MSALDEHIKREHLKWLRSVMGVTDDITDSQIEHQSPAFETSLESYTAGHYRGRIDGA